MFWAIVLAVGLIVLFGLAATGAVALWGRFT
jgi:hypothetical protein